MTRQQQEFRNQVLTIFPGLVRLASTIASDEQAAGTLIEKAIATMYRDSGGVVSQDHRPALFKSLIDAADESVLPYKRADHRNRIRKQLDEVTHDTTGSAVYDAVNGDMYGRGDVADIRRQVDESADRPSLENLHPMTRIVLQLKLQEGLNYDEIGHVCGLSRDEVRAFLMLGRRKVVDEIVQDTLSDNGIETSECDTDAPRTSAG